MNPFSRFNISVFLYILLYLAYRNNDFCIYQKGIDTTKYFYMMFLLAEHKTIRH